MLLAFAVIYEKQARRDTAISGVSKGLRGLKYALHVTYVVL